MGKKLIIKGADFSLNAIESGGAVEYTLQNGYATYYTTPRNGLDIGTSSAANNIRVRTSQIYDSYKIKLKAGYVIRAMVSYTPSLNIVDNGNYDVTSGENVSDVQGLTEYTFNNTGKYSIITICKTDANQSISADEDIVDYIERV